jgi:PKD repeat protein
MVDKNIIYGSLIFLLILGMCGVCSAYDVTVGGTVYKFNYRQQFNLSGNALWGGDQTDYVYWIDVKNGTGTANATNGTTFNQGHASQFNTTNKWADVIVTNSTSVPIKQWADTGLGDNTFVRVYFNASTISKSSNTTFYLYYGNTTVPSQQNGNATFNWFDDFEDNTVAGWSSGSGYTLAASTVSVNASGHAMNVTKSSDGWSYSTYTVPTTFTANKSYEFMLRPMQTNKQFTIGPSYGATNANLLVYGPREDGKIETYWDSTTHDGTSFSAGTWYRLRGDVYNMSNFKTYLNGSLHSSGLDKVIGTCTNLQTFQLMLYYGSSNCQVTNVFIRPWTKGDPTIGDFGSETTDMGSSPVASFTQDKTTLVIPGSVSFNDTSTNTPTSWLWQWGDHTELSGDTNSTFQNGTHQFTEYKYYTVNLTATNAFGSNLSGNTLIHGVPPVPVAAWHKTPAGGEAPIEIHFVDDTDYSYSPNQTQLWQFGDGSANSTEQSPYKTYTVAGNYTVNLTVSDDGGTNKSANQWVNITAMVPVVADFTGSPLEGTGYVGFTDTSTGNATAWSWNWGDASANSTIQNPGHVFPAGDGLYTVTHTASKTGSSDTKQKTNYIRIYGYPVANFTANVTSGLVPLNIFVNDTSTGTGIGTMFNWSWGDGTGNGTVRNMSHTYSTPGLYNITFTTANPQYTDSMVKTNYITVNNNPPVANFTTNVTSGYSPFSVSFNDTSTNSPTSWNWSFGDGTYGTTQNITHLYTTWIGNTKATFNVSLNATNSGGSNTTANTTLTEYPLNNIIGQNKTYYSDNSQTHVAFTNTISNGTATTYNWNWGDGTSNTTKNLTHIFPTTYWVTYPVVSNVSNAYSYNNTTTSVIAGVISSTFWDVIGEGDYQNIRDNSSDGPINFHNVMLNSTSGSLLGYPNATSANLSLYYPNGTVLLSQNRAINSSNDFWVNVSQIGAYGAGMNVSNGYQTTSTGWPYGHLFINNLTPKWTSNVTSGAAPLTVSFTDATTSYNYTWFGTFDNVAWDWGFNDGTSNVTTQNATHTFTTPGTYKIYHWVKDENDLNVSNIGTTPYDAVTINVTASPVYPTADFTTNVSIGYPSYDVLFTDVSTNATSWYWSFGDGQTSTTRNLTHSYNSWIGNTSATYNVNHSATNTNGTVWKNTTANQTAYPITSTMTSNLSSGKPPLVVQFNTTFGNGTATNWAWNFGDGNTSTTRNATNTYSTVGTFPVVLNASNAYSYNWQRNATMITTNPLVPPVASFTTNKTSGKIPLSIQFTDNSTNSPTSWLWQWDDGTANSTVQSPIHTFTSVGTYHVNLTSTNADGANKSGDTTITAEALTPPVANFTANITTGYIPFGVQFTDYSTNTPTAWQYNFGDGGANGTTINPIHQYTVAGTYTVILTATNADGSGTMERTNYIIANTPGSPSVPDFHANVTSGIYPLNVGFTDDTTNSPNTWAWSWGDATSNGTVKNPVHQYTAAGTYTVTLTAANSTWGGGTTAKTNYITVTAPVTPVVAFHANKTVTYPAHNILFMDDSTNTPTTWQWNYGDGTSNGTTANVIHSYSATGTYTVILTATNADGSSTLQKVDYISIIVAPTLVPFPGYTNVPTDINGDGYYEDVNGNGRFDFADVNIFATQLPWAQIHEPIPAFDFNSNGRIDFKDVILMFTSKWGV